jgi:hypothetical protein
MARFEERIRRLEERIILLPTVDEYLDASNRQRVRSLHTLAERLARHGFDGGYLFTEDNLKMVGEDTPGRRERDRETVEAWYSAQGIDRTVEVEGAKERLEARLQARS